MKIKLDLNKLKKLPLLIANHAFCSCLILFLLALIIGFFLFYKYTILAEKTGSGDLEEEYLLDESSYKEIKEVWQRQENMFQGADSKEYPNPFIESLPFPE